MRITSKGFTKAITIQARRFIPYKQVCDVSIRALPVFVFLFAFMLLGLGTTDAQWTLINAVPESASVLSISGAGSIVVADISDISIYISKDYGETWAADTTIPKWGTVGPATMLGSSVYAFTDSGLFVSPDTGKTWSRLDSGFTHGAIAMSMSNLIVASFAGAYFSSDGGQTWNQGENGFPGNFLTTSGSTVFEVGDSGIGRSTDGGESWTVVNKDDTLGIASLLASGSTLIGCSPKQPIPVGGGTNHIPPDILRSTDGGKTWSPYDNGLSTNGPPIVVAAFGRDLFVGGTVSVYSSTFDGQAWVNIGQGLLQDEGIIALFANDSSLFAGVSGYGLWRTPLSQVLSVKQPEIRELPSSVQLQQNYPNPFNPSTVISFQRAAM